MELYKQKHTDCQWMDEVTAMKACSPAELSYLGNSGVVLACENGNGSLVRTSSLDTSSDSKESQLNSDGVGGSDLYSLFIFITFLFYHSSGNFLDIVVSSSELSIPFWYT